jgi:ankyrin repeat protein
MDPFRHKPINLEGHSFRLLRLCKSEYGNVRCELIHAYLDDESLIEYEALSYTWGGTFKAHDIEVDGAIVAVTQNLSLALRSLRNSNTDRILWIDAICIDQDNDKERGHQVRQMGLIYAKAERVVIWLGPATPKTDLALEAMSRFEKESSKYACKKWKASDNRWQEIMASVQSPDGNGETTTIREQKKGLEDLMTRSWFDRVWIIQEVANARAANVACSTKTVLARTFALFPNLCGFTPSQHCQAILDVMPGPTRENSWWKKSHDLNTLLLRFRGSQASDPRDRIYALLGISSDRPTKDSAAPNFPVPNYENSEVAAVQDAISFLLQLHTGIEGRIYSPAWTLADFLQRLDVLTNETCAQAAEDGSHATVKFLLSSRDADPNFKNKEGQTPLLRAAKGGHESIVKLLLNTGKVDVNFQDKGGQTPLLQAAERGYESIVELLLNTGKAKANISNEKSQTPFLRAAQNGHSRVVRLFIERGEADIIVQDMYGRFPLLEASKNGDKATVEHLLGTGACDTDMEDKNSWNSLFTAAITGHEAIVQMLLQAKDRKSSTISQKAVLQKEKKVAFELLESYKADSNSRRDSFSQHPLTWAVQSGSAKLVELLIVAMPVDLASIRICPNCVAKYCGGRTWGRNKMPIVLWAALNRPEPIVTALLSSMTDGFASHSDWAEALLLWAVENGSDKLVRLVLAKHSRTSVIQYRSASPELIDIARTKGNLAVVQILLDSGWGDDLSKPAALLAVVTWAKVSILRRLLGTD